MTIVEGDPRAPFQRQSVGEDATPFPELLTYPWSVPYNAEY